MTLILLSLIPLTLLLYRHVERIGQVLADDKPGWWGTPLWYWVLGLGYSVLVLTLIVETARYALETKRVHALRGWAGLLVGLALVRGLLYGSLLPPWQAPDEHAHFEYAALLGQLKRVPTLDDLSPTLQHKITSSMFRYDFWRLIKRQPVESPPIGFLPQSGISQDPPTHVIDDRYLYYPQVGDDPPLYYIAPAIVYAAFPGLDTTWQLYLMRLTTVCMLVALIGGTIWASRQLFDGDMVLAMCVPTLIAFQPMLAHIGSVLNNDALAAAVTTMLLGTLVAILRSGLSWRRSVIVGVLLVLGMLTRKSVTWTIPLVAGIALAYGVRRIRWVRYGTLVAGGGVALLLLLFLIPSRQARYWTCLSSPWEATVAQRDATDGAYTLRVVGGLSEPGVLGQRLLPQAIFDLRGQSIILTAQVSADSTANNGSLAVAELDHGTETEVDFIAGPEWHPVALPLTIPDGALHVEVRLISMPESVVYFDQVTLVAPSAPGTEVQAVRNGSGEEVGSFGEAAIVGVSRWFGLGGTAQRLFALAPANLKGLLANPRATAEPAFKSFWGNFGAALVVPLPSPAYRVLALACGLSALGMAGVIRDAVTGRCRADRAWQRNSLVMLGFAVFLAVSQVIIALLAMYGAWGLQGRYLFPLIWPIGVFLTLGWTRLVPEHRRPWLWVGLTLGMVTLDCTALLRLAQYFYHL